MSEILSFKELGFITIPQIIESAEAKRLYDYTIKIMKDGNMDDGQVPGSASFYQDPQIHQLQKKLLPIVEEKIGLKLLPVFCYHRVYRTNAILRMHKDSTRAELSVTVNLGQQGEPWDICLLDYDENVHQVRLTPGDALIYWGHQLYHWRGKLTQSDLVAQAMFHCVDANGSNKLAAKLEFISKIRHFFRQKRGLKY